MLGQMVKGLTEGHLCTPIDKDNNMGAGLGRREDGAVRRWGKGEKVGTIVQHKQ